MTDPLKRQEGVFTMADFVTNPTMSVKMPVDMTSDATVAQATDTASAAKFCTMQGIKRDANLTQATAVFSAFHSSIGGGSFDSLSAQRMITEGVS